METLKSKKIEFSSKAKFKMVSFMTDVLEMIIEESANNSLQREEKLFEKREELTKNNNQNEKTNDNIVKSKNLSESISLFLSEKVVINKIEEKKNLKYYQILDNSVKKFIELKPLTGWEVGPKVNNASCYYTRPTVRGVTCVKVHGKKIGKKKDFWIDFFIIIRYHSRTSSRCL
jgi:hypothetical protein